MNDGALSPQQRHTWRARQEAYDARCVIRVDGQLSISELRCALAAVIKRHSILRTAFTGSDPEPRQVVVDGACSILLADVTACPSEGARWWRRHAMSNAGAANVLQVIVVRQGPEAHLLILSLPALCADGRSMLNLAREIADCFGKQPAAGAEVTQYSQYAAWQDALMEEDAFESLPFESLPFESLPFESLTFEKSGSAGVTGYGSQSAELAEAVVARIETAAARYQVTFAEFMLACWQVLLWQHTRAPGIVVGLVTDGRVYEELWPVVGPCAKVLPVPARLESVHRFAEVLSQVKQAAAEAAQGQEYSNWTGTSAWVFEQADLETAITAGGAAFTVQDYVAWTGPFVVKLCCQASPEAVRLVVEHERGRLSGPMAQCLLDQLVTVAASAAASPESAISALSAVSVAARRRMITDFNQTSAAWPDAKLAHQLVEAQAAAAPDRIAVTSGCQSLTYGELNQRSNRLARYLRALGAGPEVAVGICLDRTTDLVAAMLAVHKAGAAYVPIDPLHPHDRLNAIVEDTPMPIMITDEPSAVSLPAGGWRTVLLSRDGAEIAGLAGGNLNVAALPGQLAYVLHTSGSTGRPKGVQVSHEALANFLRSMSQVPGISPDDSVVAVTTLSFDIAALELYLPLTAGARVTVASRPTAADPRALRRLLTDSAATIFQATPVTWRMLIGAGWPGVPSLTALIGGEALPPELAAKVAPRVRQLWNMYGPTETTIWSTCAEITGGHVSVGQPIANTCVHVLDDDLRPVAIGMVGELCIGGVGVARGYLGRPALTAERFVPDLCRPGVRMYRTGDLARYDPAGRLFVLGRTDSQVKIRGFRVELGEIEAALAGYPGAAAAAATARPEESGETRVDAYLVLEPGVRATVTQVREFAAVKLPPAMVPARLAIVGSLPLTANGKVDRAKLPEISVDAQPRARHVPAGTRLEHVIAGIWRTVLRVEEPAIFDNFFDLGGHSVLLTAVSGLLAEELGQEITPLTLLEHPTIASLAAHLQAGTQDTVPQNTVPQNTVPPDARPAAAGRERLRQRRSRAQDPQDQGHSAKRGQP